MLPAESRMHKRNDFAVTIRRGSRVSQRLLTGYLLTGAQGRDDARLAGFVVSRAVGRAVVRNRVRRRLRAVAAASMRSLPQGSLLVVRAHPQAATARQAELAADLDVAISKLVRRQVGVLRR